MSDPDPRVRPGAVVQITEAPESHTGWIGAFVLVTEVKAWGVQGFVHILDTHATHGSAFTRLTWDRFAYIGDAVLMIDRVPEESPDA